jgi:hypothetical protein
LVKRIINWQSVGIFTAATLLLPTLIAAQSAYATHCADSTHCYGIEYNSVTNYGNSFTTIITDMSMTSTCSYVLTVEQWIDLPNGDWMEQGFTIGGFIDQPCATSEVNFHAKRISGVYHDYNDGAILVGQTKTYELSDENKDKRWDVKINGATATNFVIPYTSGIGQQVGTETSHHSPTLPKTHVWDVAMLKTTGWAYWATGTLTQESPMWIINCTPNYKHVHVGSGAVGNCL